MVAIPVEAAILNEVAAFPVNGLTCITCTRFVLEGTVSVAP